MKKAVKAGIIGAGALGYSIIPTYLMKYHWIIRDKKMAKKEEKVLYLTFDDGPDTVYTNKLLDLLDQEQVPATFFMVAEAAQGHPDIVKRMKKSGYSIGIHSLSHQSAMLFGPGRTKRDLKESRKIMGKMGIDVKEYRPPWGHLNLMSLYCIRKMHLQLIFWDVMAQDWSAKETADSICNKILRRVFPGAVICLHDGRGENGAPGRTIEALKKAIPMLKAQGYEFRRIESVWNAMKNADPKWLTAGLGLAAVFNIAEGINLRKVLVSFGYRVSFKEAMKYAYIGYFFSSVTPSATGGQPLQLYAMSKDKIHVAHGTMALLTELTSFQIAAFLMENIAAFWILTGRIHLNKIMLILALVGYIMNLVFIAALMIVIISDRLKRKIVKGIRFLVMKLPFRHKEKMESKINDILHDFENCKDFFKKDPNLTLQVIGVSLVQIICWFSVPWAVYHAMGEAGSTFGSLFLHQIILYMTTALLPFPGAEGISEFSFVKLFAGMFSSVPVAAVVLVNRGISFYFLLILSGILGVVLGRFNGRSADQSGTKYKLQQETENGTGKILT